jgi:hypothetical protein
MTNNKQQTAVEWLVEQFKEYDFADVKDTENYIIKMQSFVLTEKLEQAKEMQKEQSQAYAAFCVACDRKKLPLLEFDGWVKLGGDEQ